MDSIIRRCPISAMRRCVGVVFVPTFKPGVRHEYADKRRKYTERMSTDEADARQETRA